VEIHQTQSTGSKQLTDLPKMFQKSRPLIGDTTWSNHWISEEVHCNFAAEVIRYLLHAHKMLPILSQNCPITATISSGQREQETSYNIEGLAENVS